MKASTTYKFKVEIRISEKGVTNGKPDGLMKLVKQYYAVIIGRNGEPVFTGELRKSRYGLVKTIKNLFSNVEISNAK